MNADCRNERTQTVARGRSRLFPSSRDVRPHLFFDFFYRSFRCQPCHKCLNCHLASFEALLSLEQNTINDPTPSWRALPFCVLSSKKRYPSKLCNFYAFSYHIDQTRPVKEFCWSRNGAFFGRQTKPPMHIPTRRRRSSCACRRQQHDVERTPTTHQS